MTSTPKMEWSIRITTMKYQFDDIKSVFDPICSKYIIALENESSNRHFQCYIKLIKEDDAKGNAIRYAVKKWDPTMKGNQHISITKMKKETLMVYVTKDGNYIYKGFTEEDIKTLAGQSYKKKKTFMQESKDLENAYLAGEIRLKDISRRYIDIHIRHCVNFNKFKIESYMTRLLATKDSDYAEHLAVKVDELFSSHIRKENYALSSSVQSWEKIKAVRAEVCKTHTLSLAQKRLLRLGP